MHKSELILCLFFFYGCNTESAGQRTNGIERADKIKPGGETLLNRIKEPEGFKRVNVKDNSFASYLRNIPLQPHGRSVHYYDGRVKKNKVHEAVVKIDVGAKDLQQCADAIMRLRAEYLLKTGRPENIHFNFTNGFRADYSKWKKGYRIKVNGNRVSWVKTEHEDSGYLTFRRYLDMVFNYAGTMSLSRELTRVAYKDMHPGDVLIQGGSPGHAVLVMDMAVDKDGKKVYLLAQSYMPAQEIHVLKNFNDGQLSPWYELKEGVVDIQTPEWDFASGDLKRFDD
jgi:hypothetical protein